ncbi:hypothetical protein EGN72_03165 [Pseudorhodobacter sp. E13]|uniref:hypothetical protein n=1 Tax=Pseudorhodobacter sp. E13 TaxID=2487931 RepID=UPI000F8C7F11|nr:hypothetical protein [Pseudorhodobacter sp. E13]RUS63656.1 hypothetical protein EGN72_03165 [Pseudorhodobacter sp. E13]
MDISGGFELRSPNFDRWSDIANSRCERDYSSNRRDIRTGQCGYFEGFAIMSRLHFYVTPADLLAVCKNVEAKLELKILPTFEVPEEDYAGEFTVYHRFEDWIST